MSVSDLHATDACNRFPLQWLSLCHGIAPLTSLLKNNVTHILMRLGPGRQIKYGFRMNSEVAKLSLEKYRSRIEPELRAGVKEQMDCELVELIIE